MRLRRDTPWRATGLVFGLFGVGIGAGAWAGSLAVSRANDPYSDLDLFARVLTTIESDYVEAVPAERLVDGAIKGMVRELDPQSRWLEPEQGRAWQNDAHGVATGIGVDVRATEGGVEIVRVLPGSPARRDGLAPGDTIVSLDGQPLEGLSLDDVEARLHGDRGEPAVLTIQRPGQAAPLEVKTVRDEVRVPSVEGALLAPGTAYVHLTLFQEGAARDLADELARLGTAAPLTGLVLDLRDNPGGLLTEAVGVADLFLDSGTIVSTRERAALLDPALPPDELHLATPGGLPATTRVAVLVNGGSASASEVVASALQDTGRGVLVGTTTYGKGTVQQVYRHPNDAALKLTVGRYFTASGKPVADHQGRTPDLVVPYPTPANHEELLRAKLQEVAGLSDDDRAALLALMAGLPPEDPNAPAIPWDAPIAERTKDDPQVKAALDWLAR